MTDERANVVLPIPKYLDRAIAGRPGGEFVMPLFDRCDRERQALIDREARLTAALTRATNSQDASP